MVAAMPSVKSIGKAMKPPMPESASVPRWPGVDGSGRRMTSAMTSAAKPPMRVLRIATATGGMPVTATLVATGEAPQSTTARNAAASTGNVSFVSTEAPAIPTSPPPPSAP